MHAALSQAFLGFKFATKGVVSDGVKTIDHIAHTPDLTLTGGGIKVWPKCADRAQLTDLLPDASMDRMRKCADGAKLRLSDHFGVWGDFRLC